MLMARLLLTTADGDATVEDDTSTEDDIFAVWSGNLVLKSPDCVERVEVALEYILKACEENSLGGSEIV